MPWVRVDDHFDEHPKHSLAGPLCWALWLAGLAYCNRNLTDGFIPWAVARKLVSWTFLDPPDEEGRQRRVTVSVTSGMSGNDVTSEMIIERLLMAELWKECKGGYKIHDYPDYQPSRKDVLTQREHNAIRQQRHRVRNAVTPQVTNAERNAVTNDPITALPVPVPVPVPIPNTRENKRLLSGSDKPDVARDVLTYLNSKTGHKYRPEKTNLALIQARLATATVEQIQAVIDAKVTEWKGDQKMRQFLRPSTLFRATNFEQYLGQINNGQPLIGSRPADRNAWEGVTPGKVKL